MPTFIHDGTTWQEVTKPSFNLNGTQVDLTTIYVNVGGSYLSVWESTKVWDTDTYLVLGSATSVELNRALSQMSKGGRLLFGEGTWLLDKPLLVKKSNITIQGVSNLTILKCNSDFSEDGTITVSGIQGSEITNILISGIRLDVSDNGERNTGIKISYVGNSRDSGISIKDCIIENSVSYGVSIEHSSNSVITSCVIQNNTKSGIYSVDSSNIGVSNNIIQNNDSHGLSLVLQDSVISGNLIQNNKMDGVYDSSTRNMIVGNTIQNNGDGGIRIESSTFSIILSNTVQNNSRTGIYSLSSSKNVISSNTCQRNAGKGISIEDSYGTVVSSNITRYNGDTGTYFYATANNNLISSNVSIGNTTGNLGDSGLNNTKVYNFSN